ncbi:MAG: outer membrane beta-barrel protein [Brachymonas sp.]|jgi:opacity protein-like surface antigen
MKKASALLGLLLACGAALAQDAAPAAETAAAPSASAFGQSFYGELGLATLRGSNSNLLTGKFKPTMLRGVVGSPINPWLNGELMLGIGMQGKSAPLAVPFGTTTAATGLEVKTMLGLYLTPTLNFANGGKVYGRVGWNNITFSDVPQPPVAGLMQSTGVFSKHDSLAWGLGGAIPVGQNFTVNADYMQYYKRKNEKLDGFSIGLGYKF